MKNVVLSLLLDCYRVLGNFLLNTKTISFPDKKEFIGENAESGDAKPEEGSKKDEKKKEKTGTDKKKEEKKAKKEPKKPKIEILKEPLEFEVSLMDLANITADHKKSSREKLDALTAHDREKKARYNS